MSLAPEGAADAADFASALVEEPFHSRAAYYGSPTVGADLVSFPSSVVPSAYP